ncbi:MAG: MgtC/SapB family protein [Actinomycetota bacterium]
MPTLEWWELGLRLFGAALLGGLIGFEREYSDQPAGFRTHILVTLGATLFTMAGAYGTAAFVDAGVVRFDPTRVAAQVVTGIGFLGAGAILRQGINIRGLTTAASIWVTASIGVAVALGFWAAAVMATGIALGSLLFLRSMERLVLRSLRKNVFKVVLDLQRAGNLSDVHRVFDRYRVHIRSMKTVGEPGEDRQMVSSLELPEGLSIEELADALGRIEDVTSVDWTH